MNGTPRHTVADLVCRVRNSDAPIYEQHAAFTILVRRFEEMAFATALRACHDVEAARDACQEAFLVAWRTLPSLREPAAFGGWLKCLVRTHCTRARRRRSASAEVREHDSPTEIRERVCDPTEAIPHDVLRLIRHAVTGLPAREREAVTLFYFLGEPLRVVAQELGVTVAIAGKAVYMGRLRLRRCLPRSIAEAYLVIAPTPAFSRRVQAGVFDEFVGHYRFAKRPGHCVIVRREGDVLAGYAGGQRNVLASHKPDTLAPTEYDGEGRFRRNQDGHISHFIYYEFGRRLGVAHKVVTSPTSESGAFSPRRI